MTVLMFILKVILTIIALVYLVLMLIRTFGNNRKWKVMEPKLVESIEKSLGQKIVFKTLQNALPSPEADHREAFWLWLAFTAEYVVFAIRDELVEGRGDDVFIARKRDTSIMRVNKYHAEFEVKNKDTSEVSKLILLVNRSRYELLAQYIPERRGNVSRF